MQRQPAFEPSYRRHLAAEQRKAVLEVLKRKFDVEVTVGQIVDTAQALGWPEVGDLSLADLADALLSEVPSEDAKPSAPVEDDEDDEDDEGDADAEDEDEDEDSEDDEDEDSDDEDEDEDEEDEAPPAKPARGKAAPAAAKKAGKKTAKVAESPPAKPAAKGGKGKPGKISLDDRMSVEEAQAVLLPIVAQLGQATMQELEALTTGAGRRKLRFHVGQLVRNGKLERHGMGRGTYYTVS